MRNRKTFIFLAVLMLSALLVLGHLALADPPLKPDNPGLPGCLAEVAELRSQALVRQTGQTICYDINGGEIDCEGTGQDSEFQNGIPCPEPRFIDNEPEQAIDAGAGSGFIWSQGKAKTSRVWPVRGGN